MQSTNKNNKSLIMAVEVLVVIMIEVLLFFLLKILI